MSLYPADFMMDASRRGTPKHYKHGKVVGEKQYVQVAIETLEAPAVILFGGQGKQDETGTLGFAAIAPMCAKHQVITFGHSAITISTELAASGIYPLQRCVRMCDAVEVARRALQNDPSIKYVLLSPGCASFDEFSSFGERGCQFAALATSNMV